MRNNSTWAPSALSPIPWPKNAWNPWLIAVNFIAVILLNIVPAVVYLVVWERVLRPSHASGTPPPFQLLLAQLAAYPLVVAYLMFVLPSITHVSLSELGIRKPTGRELSIGLVGTAVMWLTVILSSSAASALSHRHDTESAIEILKALKGPWQVATFVVLACVFAPIVEELIFRVFVFGALTRYVPISAAAILSGALFGVTHALGQDPGQLITVGVPLALGGVVLAYVYATTRCFWSNVLTHAAFNTINTFVLIVLHGS